MFEGADPAHSATPRDAAPVLTDESVCPTLLHKGLRFGGAGASACQLRLTPKIPKAVKHPTIRRLRRPREMQRRRIDEFPLAIMHYECKSAKGAVVPRQGLGARTPRVTAGPLLLLLTPVLTFVGAVCETGLTCLDPCDQAAPLALRTRLRAEFASRWVIAVTSEFVKVVWARS